MSHLRTPNPGAKQLAPSDIARLNITDYRPNKALYANVYNNNDYRLYLQRNANKIRGVQKQIFNDTMGYCGRCEGQTKGIVPFKKQYKARCSNPRK